MSLGKKTVQGILWNYLSFASSKLLVFVSTVILARLLAPEHFGLVAMALLALHYLDAIHDLGIGAALIYQRDNLEKAAQVAFYTSILVGAALTGIAFVSAPAVAAYFNEPRVVPMLRVLSFTVLIQSFGNVHIALLSKELEFRRKLFPDLSKTFFKGVGSIVFALLGWGAWSLVWGQVLGAFAATIALWVVNPWRPKLMWDWGLARTMMSYGVQILLIEILSVVWDTADYIIIGRWLGTTDLGLYQQAFRISDLVILNICFIAGRVLFPSFSKLNHSMDAMRNGFLTTLRYIAMATLPVTAGLVAVAPLFVDVVFGDKWLAMAPALRWLALRAGLTTLAFNSGHVLRAIGRPGLINKQLVVKLAVMIPVILMTVQYGYVGVALGQVGVAIFGALLELGTIAVVLKVPVSTIWRQIQPALLSALGMGLVVGIFAYYAPDSLNLPWLVASIGLGILTYLGLLWLTERQLVTDSVRSLARILRPERPVTGKVPSE